MADMNLLFISCDQWRGDALSCAGHPALKTPNLDILAADGVRFAKHFGQSAPCSPGRASLYTGLYAMNHRVVSNSTPLEDRHANFATEMRKLGYDPVMAGYTDICADPEVGQFTHPNDPDLHKYGSMRGITSLEPGNHARGAPAASGWAAWLEEKGYEDIPESIFIGDADDIYSTGTYPHAQVEGMVRDDPEQYTAINGTAGFSTLVDSEGFGAPAFHAAEHCESAYSVDLGMRHIRARRGAPWALHVSTYRPHPPWLASAPFSSAYHHSVCGGAARHPTTEAEGKAHPWLADKLRAGPGGGNAPADEAELNMLRSQYFACCAEVDASLGKLFDFLKERGLWEKTVIIFTADHGEQLGEHHILSKTGFFDGSYHLPCIIRDPRPSADVSRGTAVTQYSESVDVLPTICEIFGLPVPPAVDGRSLLPFLQGSADVSGWKDAAHFEFDFRDDGERLGFNPHDCTLCVLRGERWKYVQFAVPEWPPLLYDLQADPHEMRNLALEPGHEHTIMECAMAMLRWRMRHTDHRVTHLSLGVGGATSSVPTLHEAFSTLGEGAQAARL